jgi:hypothetical protein
LGPKLLNGWDDVVAQSNGEVVKVPMTDGDLMLVGPDVKQLVDDCEFLPRSGDVLVDLDLVGALTEIYAAVLAFSQAIELSSCPDRESTVARAVVVMNMVGEDRIGLLSPHLREGTLLAGLRFARIRRRN